MDRTATDADLIADILKRCFPRAQNVRLVRNTLEDGDLHFSSEVTHVVVEFERDGRTQRHQVVVKVPSGGAIGVVFESLDVFRREICMYERVIPRMRAYLDEDLTPALLYASESRISVLDDLTGRGYESGEKMASFDFDRAEAVLKALAHFHAASHRLHAEDPHLLRQLLADHIPTVGVRRILTSTWAPVALELLRRKQEPSLAAKVKLAVAFLERDDVELKALLQQSAFAFRVLNHGDSRKDNTMLRFGCDGHVDSVRFIDLQMCVWSTPVLDLVYFFTTSVALPVVEARFDDLVDGYLRELNAKLEKLGCAAYAKADFRKDYERLRFYVFCCVLFLSYVISPLDRGQKEKLYLEPNPDIGHLCSICLNDEHFVKSVYGWLKYCEKSHVFDAFSSTYDIRDEVPHGRL